VNGLEGWHCCRTTLSLQVGLAGIDGIPAGALPPVPLEHGQGMNQSIGELMAHLARTNIELWHEEDKARVSDDHQVAAAKRNVDRLNQQRNDLIEQIDAEVRRLATVGEKSGG
jgi:hypothetical protein